jgi:acyl-CoA thioesterase
VLLDSSSPVATAGLVAGNGSAWNRSGELLATCSAQLVCLDG